MKLMVPAAFIAVVVDGQDIVTAASSYNVDGNRLEELVAQLSDANLVAAVQGLTTATVFAPTDAAFTALASRIINTSAAAYADATANNNTKILTLHVFADGQYCTTDVGACNEIPEGDTGLSTLNGEQITVNRAGGTVTVNGAAVIGADVTVDQGVVHVIDNVILPIGLRETIVGAAQAATPEFTILVEKLIEANLVDAVDTSDLKTVFAPTNAAFAAFVADADSLLNKALDADTLAAILKYHVHGGEIAAPPASDVDDITTLQGEKLKFKAGSEPMIGGAKITGDPINRANGTIHVIDKVLIPPTLMKKTDSPPKDDDPETSSNAVAASSAVVAAVAGSMLLF